MRVPAGWWSLLALLALAGACGDDGDGKRGGDAQVDPNEPDGALPDGDPFVPFDGSTDLPDQPTADGGGLVESDASADPDSATADATDGATADATDGAIAPGNEGDAATTLDAAVDASSPTDAATVTDAGSDAAAVGQDAQAADAGGQIADAGGQIADAGTPSDAGADAGAPTCSAASAPAIGTIGLRTVFSSNALEGLTDAVQPPGSKDWYLVEQRGRVLVLRDGASSLEPEPFLDLTAEIGLPNARIYDDRGLVSIAFAPNYASSGLVYVSVTPDRGAQANVDLLLEYKRDGNNLRVAPASRRVIAEVRGSRLDSNGVTINIHNGGRVAFGPDGLLYWAMGDGGGVNCGDVEPNATQDVSSLFGKILRLDLTRPAPYGAAGNPFANGGDPRVYHYGLRNPFRFSFDRLNGDFYIGDVGQNRYEEIDYAPAGVGGLNFGWAPFEGNSTDTCPGRALRAGSTHTPPIFVADRRAGSTNPFADLNAMIGGVVYRGSALPALRGAYLFGGYRSRRIGALYQCGTATSPVRPVLKSCDPNEPNSACLRRLDGGPAFSELRAFVEDAEGEVYVVANGNSLLKLVPAN